MVFVSHLLFSRTWPLINLFSVSIVILTGRVFYQQDLKRNNVTNTITMKAVAILAHNIINCFRNHPHASIFTFLLCGSIILHGIVISSIGLPLFIDSFMHPNEYELIASDQFIILDHYEQGSKVLIQKQTHPSFSINQNDTLCSRNHFGLYRIEESLTGQNDSITSVEIIGKVIMVIPDNSLESIAIAWYQQTKEFIQQIQA